VICLEGEDLKDRQAHNKEVTDHKKLVTISSEHTLRARVESQPFVGNSHVRFVVMA